LAPSFVFKAHTLRMYFMNTKQIQKQEIVIHDFDKGLDHTIKAIEKLSTTKSTD